jgi:hypothetical protein
MTQGTMIVSILSSLFFVGTGCVVASLFERDPNSFNHPKIEDNESYLEEFHKSQSFD